MRLHTSSGGTTGIPTVIYHTRHDLDSWTNLVARAQYRGHGRGQTRCAPEDHECTAPFTGGSGLHYGAERVGMTVIPIGGGNTKRQLQLMGKDFRSTVAHITPSYLLHIYSKLEELGFSCDDFALKKAYLGAEPYSENTRKKLEKLFGIDAYNSYGLSEMNGPGVSFECVHKCGMHTWEDAYVLEIIDPKMGKSLADEKRARSCLPRCSAGQRRCCAIATATWPMCIKVNAAASARIVAFSRIIGRTDDMLIVNGVNMFPSQIEEVIMRIPEVGNNYVVQLDKVGALDKLIVKVEIYSKMFTGDLTELDRLKSKISDELRASIVLHPAIELHEPGSLPVSEGKAKRVIDNRPKI